MVTFEHLENTGAISARGKRSKIEWYAPLNCDGMFAVKAQSLFTVCLIISLVFRVFVEKMETKCCITLTLNDKRQLKIFLIN